ncbi:MAG TPA: histidine kinase [Moheibacter sp.]|nr:histidine kinase [Moheibacter sp.]
MTKRQEISIHFTFWILFIGMNRLSELIYNNKELPLLWSVLQEIGFTLLQMIIFYINYLWICPKSVPQKKWIWLISGQVFLLFLFPVLRYIIEEIIIFEMTGKHNYADGSRVATFYLYDNSYFALRVILLSLVFYFVKTVWNSNQKINQLQLEKKQAELQNLKNQLSPHFLFNTLNSFYADLMDEQPKTADDILKLSEMLRYITYENEEDEVYLKDEIQFIQNYIDLFSRRFDGRSAIEFNYDENQIRKKIPSLLLIHFVENALKHGISNDNEKPVKIQLKTTEDRLFLVVANYFKSNENYDETGIGYKNIRQRLNILFPKNHILEVRETESLFKVKLEIPLTK